MTPFAWRHIECGTFSTGTNIPSIENIIFASPYKSVIKVLQSIGRGLRVVEGKEMCNLYDISDKLSDGKQKNHGMKHLIERLEIYIKSEFKYKIVEVPIE